MKDCVPLERIQISLNYSKGGKMSEKSSDDEQIPMADEEEDEHDAQSNTPQETTNITELPVFEDVTPKNEDVSVTIPAPSLFDNELSPEEQEEKARLIAQVLELQNTLDDLSSRVDNVKEENYRLWSENQVLGQYIENLMAASSVFQPANDQPKSKRK